MGKCSFFGIPSTGCTAGCRDAVLGEFCGTRYLVRMWEQKHRWVEVENVEEVEDVEDREDASARALSGFGPVSAWQSFLDSDTTWL